MAMPLQPKRQRLNHKSTNKSSLDHHLESVFALSDTSVPFDLSLERILESRVLQSDKEHLIHVALRVGSALLDAANRSARKLAAAHNSSIWPLPPELTVQVLSFLDTTSLCYASATCTTFNRCARDPLCYANIDLVNGPKVVNSVVSTMIQRAGKNLKSLKLGTCSIFDSEGNRDMNWHRSLLTRSCLGALSFDNGASGALLQKLCLHNINDMDTHSLTLALSDCKSLVDLEIVGIKTVDLGRTLTAVSDHCPLIERLCFEYPNSGVPLDLDVSQDLDVTQFDNIIQKCNMLSSIAIRGYILDDFELCKLIKGLPKLKHADFSSSIDLEGFFLGDLGNGEGGDSLETLILRDCESFLSAPIGRFFSAILAGKWKSLRFLDVSSNYETICGVDVLHAVKELRPEICLIAQFKPPKDMNDTSSSSSDDDAQNGDKQEINSSSDDSSSDDEDSPNGDEPNSDSSSDDSSSQDLVTQNDSSSDDSSSEDEVTQIGGEPNSDSSSEDEITQIGGDQNLDSSSDDVQDH